MNRPEDPAGAFYDPADDHAARVIAFFGPYVFWSVVGIVAGVVLMLG